MIQLTFADAQFARSGLRDRYDLLLGVEATLTVTVNARTVYVEPMFPIVELRVALAAWLDAEPKSHFEFDSMEADEHGVIWFRQCPTGAWSVGSVFGEGPAPDEIPIGEVASECLRFVGEVDAWVRQHLHVEVADVLELP